MIEPLEEAILMDELDAAATSARVPERIIRVSWITTDPADVLLLFLLFRHFKPRGAPLLVVVFLGWSDYRGR